MATEKEQFLMAWDTEHATTRKLLAAIPEAKRDFRPHEKSMSARELAWHLVGKNKSKGLPNTLDIGARIGLSLWH